MIGGAGYNTVNECLATGTPLIARPWPRKYDRQRERAERTPGITIVDTPDEAAEAALRILKQPTAARPESRTEPSKQPGGLHEQRADAAILMDGIGSPWRVAAPPTIL